MNPSPTVSRTAGSAKRVQVQSWYRCGAMATPVPAAFALVLALAGGCGGSDAHAQVDKPQPTVDVTTAVVSELPMPEFLTLTGTLKAHEQASVAANSAGIVIATLVERGQSVRKGDVIARLDVSKESLTAAAARAQANLAQSQLDIAERDCARADALLASGAISQSDYDRAVGQCKTAKWSTEAAQANQRVASKNVGDATIRAPFSGIIGERRISVGEYVQPTSTVVSMYAIDPIHVEMTVPEQAVGAVRKDLSVEFEVAAFPGQKFTAKVQYISPNIRQTSRDLVVEAVVSNADGKLLPGMFATARLLRGESKVATVPLGAVRKDGGTAHLFAVDKRGEVVERIAQLGTEKDGMVAVIKGVLPGERVVMNPGDNIRDGLRVQ